MEEQLVAALKGTLEPDGAVVNAAERHLVDDLHPRPETGLALANIVLTDSAASGVPIELRQAAAVSLSKWIKERWGAFFDDFIGFQITSGAEQPSSSSNGRAAGLHAIALPAEYKVPIRQALLQSMSLPESKLRGPMIKALINVASCDWPDEFPDLLPRVKASLLSAATTGQLSQGQTEGALAFLDEWSYSSMDESSLVSVTRELFPDLERLVSDASQSAQIRCHCIRILSQTLDTLHLVQMQFEDAAKAAANDLLPTWIGILLSILATDTSTFVADQTFTRSAGEQLALIEQGWLTLTTITAFPSHVKSHAQKILELAVSSLDALRLPFERYHVNDSGSLEVPDDGRFSASPQSLAGSIIEFLIEAMGKKMFSRATSTEFAATLVPLLVSFSKITAADEEEWLADSSEFVAAGDDDEAGAIGSSLRARCTDVLTAFSAKRTNGFVAVLQKSADLAHREGQARHKRGDTAWWKEDESILYLIGAQAADLIEGIDDVHSRQKDAPLNIEEILRHSVVPFVNARDAPVFLLGRCFVFASQFASILPRDLAAKFLDNAVTSMQDQSEPEQEGSDIVKLSAVRCIKNFHHHLPHEATAPYAEAVLSNIAPLLQQDNEDLLVLVIETLLAVSGQSEEEENTFIPAHIYGDIAAACIQSWARNPNCETASIFATITGAFADSTLTPRTDFVVQNTIDDMLASFAALKELSKAEATLHSSIPVLVGLLERHQNNIDDDLGPTTVGGALHFASSLARDGAVELLQKTAMLDSIFVPLFAITGRTDDRAIFQSAAELLTILFEKLPNRYVHWADAQGASAVQHTLSLVSKLIAPDDVAESGGLAPGNLVTTMLRKEPHCLQPHLEDLTRAFVARLASTQMPPLAQSLIIPLAYLTKDYADVMVQLLLNMPIMIPNGTSEAGIAVFLSKWLEFASSIQGFWHSRISTLGLCALFSARIRVPALAKAIDAILVDGDLIPDNVNIIKTRSRSKNMPDRFTQVPIPAKIIKTVTAEYKDAIDGPPQRVQASQESSQSLTAHEDNDEGDWDDDGEDEDDEGGMLDDDFFGDLADFREMERKDQEKSFGDDEVWNMPYRTYLKEFFRQAAQDPSSATLIEPHLNPKEVTLVRNALS